MALPPFHSSTDYLQIIQTDYYSGLHEKNARQTFYSASGATLQNNFTAYSGTGTKNGEWWADAGDLTLASNIRENRVFGVIGKYTQIVNGTSIIVRIETEWGRGTMKVKIDGVAPSTIAGVVNPLDTINFDCETNGLTKDYHDIIIAENLAAGNHTVELYAENTAGKYVAVTGIKTSAFVAPHITKTGWRADFSTQLNYHEIKLRNTSSYDVLDVTITPNTTMKKWDGTALTTIGPFNIAAGATYTLQFAFDVTDYAIATINKNFTLNCLYRDAAGTIVRTALTTYGIYSTALTFSGTGWVKEFSAAINKNRAFSTGIGKTVVFTTSETSFVIQLQKEYNWGQANVLVDGVQFAVLSCHDAVGGGFLQDVTVSGMAAGTKTITLSTVNGGARPFCFTEIRLSANTNFSSVTETINFDFAMQHIPPYTPPNVRINTSDTTLPKGMITWDNPNKTLVDTSNKKAPRANTNVTEARVYSRFPTYCVYYGPGKDDILSQYDLLVIEPKAVSRKQVMAWQAKGIKVLGYVSFGEEDGDRVSKYDLGSTELGPHIDDGLGTGGYASYYNKGGNLYGEPSECQNDKQRIYGQKACALSNPKYFTGTGRCSKVCTKDSRLGYITWEAGGACAGGYTKNNKWQRDASAGCSNTTCAGYTPKHGGCTQWEQSEVAWGQDFSQSDTFPDQNGIWNSTFINPLAPRWKEKLNTYYLPYTLGAQVQYTETHALTAFTGAVDGSKLVFQTAHYPIDDEETLIVTNAAGTFTYTANLDYSYDKDTGVFSLALDAGVGAGQAAPVAGQNVQITYTRKGLQCDGVFMDTVDTVDVYPSVAYQTAFADMINDLKTLWSNKYFCSNRGFTILPQIIKSCSYVMFETFISEYDWATGNYFLITDPDSVAYNNDIKAQLKDLRKTNKFDVLALNYAANDASGDSIRQYVAEQCYNEGYISWTSVISLQDPLAPAPINLSKGRIRTNLWKLQFRKKV